MNYLTRHLVDIPWQQQAIRDKCFHPSRAFLNLGRDSLLAGQVVSRVISEFQVELPLRSLFQAPTVADMALAITQRRAEAADQADIERMLAEVESVTAEKAKELATEESSAGISHEQS